MKKVYMKPATDIVVLNLGEQIAWGEGANASNTGTYTEGKEQDLVEDDDFFSEREYVSYKKVSIKNLWDDDERLIEDY